MPTATEHMNKSNLAVGNVDWVAWLNDFLAKAALQSSTILLTAGENLAARDPFYIKAADGKAWKAANDTECHGVWQSATTAAEATGFGQIAGIYTYASWTWTPGSPIYVNAGALSHTEAGALVGSAINATQMIVSPMLLAAEVGAIAETYRPFIPPASPHANDEEFDNAVLSTAWGEWDAGTVLTVTEETHGLKLLASNSTGSKVCGVYKAIPAGNWSMDSYVSLGGQTAIGAGTGIFLSENVSSSPTTAKVVIHGLFYRNTAADYIYYGTVYYTSYTTSSSTWRWMGNFTVSGCYLRIVKSGTTYYFLVSSDGIGWFLFYTQASMPFTPTHCGVWVNDEGNGGDVTGTAQFVRFSTSVDLYRPVSGRRI